MKKFLRNIAIFALIMVACDVSFGYCFDYMIAHVKGGGVAKRYHIAKNSDEEILMFGSSRMSHHYNPNMIEDSLGLTCYNCGEDGLGIIYSYGMLQMVLKRYTPKVIIYDISGFDVETDDMTKYINSLKPYASDPDVRNHIASVSSNERLKLCSKLYRYNSRCIGLIGGMLGYNIINKGFLPLDVVMDYEPEIVKQSEIVEIDPLKEKCIRSMIEECESRNIKLIFAVSPRYKGDEFAPSYPEVKKICDEYGIDFIDCIGLRDVANHKEYFKDQTHMNRVGANIYTDTIINRLKPILGDIYIRD